MKRRAGRLSSAFALAATLASSAGVTAGVLDSGMGNGQQIALARSASQADAMPTVVVQTARPAMATVVVTAVKNSGNAVQPLLVFFVMVLFGGVVLHLRQNSRNIKA